MKQGALITERWVNEELINVGTGLAVTVTDNYCFVQLIKIKIKSTHRNSSSSIPMRGAGGGTVLMLTQVRWEFLLELGQGNETLDYLGSLLWRERERERERERSSLSECCYCYRVQVTWHHHTSLHYRDIAITSDWVKISWFIGRQVSSIITASELHHRDQNCQRLNFLSATEAQFKQSVNLSISTLFLTSWSGRLRLQKCILHRSRGGGRYKYLPTWSPWEIFLCLSKFNLQN